MWISPFHHAGRYSSLKAGVLGLTRQMAVDFGPLGVRVNAICPGLIVKESFEQTLREDPEHKACTYHMQQQLPLLCLRPEASQKLIITSPREPIPRPSLRRAARYRQRRTLPVLVGGQVHHGPHAVHRWRADDPAAGGPRHAAGGIQGGAARQPEAQALMLPRPNKLFRIHFATGLSSGCSTCFHTGSNRSRLRCTEGRSLRVLRGGS